MTRSEIIQRIARHKSLFATFATMELWELCRIHQRRIDELEGMLSPE